VTFSSLIVFGALPIREQPDGSSLVSPHIAFFGALSLGLLVVVVVVLIARARRRHRESAFDERRISAMMDELCREGWTAQLTLYGSGAPLPPDAPDVEGIRVRLDWAELSEGEPGHRDVAVARRFWSRSVAAALNTMVEDRRIDFQLEQIERANRPDA
jgi:hypothetical protein